MSGFEHMQNRRVRVHTGTQLTVDFEMDRRGIRKIAMGLPLAEATRSAVVHRAMPYAIQISPRGETLDYVSSWRAQDTQIVINGMRRVATKLVNVSDHAAAVEWGRGGRAGVLRRTLAHLNSTSPIGLEQAARRARWNPDLHPRGAGGRFRPKQQAMRDVVSQEVKNRAGRSR